VVELKECRGCVHEAEVRKIIWEGQEEGVCLDCVRFPDKSVERLAGKHWKDLYVSSKEEE